jgi:hypothetical protein
MDITRAAPITYAKIEKISGISTYLRNVIRFRWAVTKCKKGNITEKTLNR